MSLSREKQIAVAAVRRACLLTSSLFQHLLSGETVTKIDESPVTVGDFSSQAVISTILSNTFPNDPIVGEENASELRLTSKEKLCTRITALVNETLTAELQQEEESAWGLGPDRGLSTAEILDMIDRGKHEGSGTGRFWTLDPIDGTKGFLRGGQYAVCLALIVDSQVQLGVVGCPNLPLSSHDSPGPRGCIFYAVRGEGTYQVPLSDPFKSIPVPLNIPSSNANNLRIWQSIGHTRLSLNDNVVKSLNIILPSVSMDSQAKYCSILREGGIYLRLAEDPNFREMIWDHAPSTILIEEAGGIVTDANGQPLDFGRGRTLASNYGVIAACKDIQDRVLEVVKQLQAPSK